MKNLHKKISAAVLAGMVVFGGFAVSGVNAFANSSSKVSVKSLQQVQPDRRVDFYARRYGRVISFNQDEKKINEEPFYDRKKCYNYGRSVDIKVPSEIVQHVYLAKYSKMKFVKIHFNGLFYLIALY